jgi:hypothetical protein
VKESWDDCGADTQALILGFDQIRCHDEELLRAALLPR